MKGAALGLLITTGLIFALGLVMIFNTSSAEILDQGLDLDTHRALIRQVLYALVGCALAWGAHVVGYRQVQRLCFLLLGFFTLLLILNFVPGIGVKVNGARRWIGLAGYTFQASEFVKLLLPACFVHAVLSQGGGEAVSLRNFLKIVAVLSVPTVLILIQPDHSTTAIIGVVLTTQCLLLGLRPKYWALPLLCLTIVGGAAASQSSYVSGRLRVYLDPTYDIRGRGHQPHQAKIAAGSGGLLGRGPGRSLQKLSYLPEAQNDYIAAIYAEEFGFLGVLALLILYMSFTLLGFLIAYQAADREGFLLACSLTFLISIQAFLNLGVVSGLLPSTGINLPLFSQGGSSLMANLVAIGVLIDIGFQSKRVAQPV